MKMKYCISVIMFLVVSTTVFAQKDNRLVRRGNKEYDKQNYSEAETNYLKALDVNYSSVPATYNLGVTRYRQDSMKQAIENWSATALNQENNADLRSQSFYNMGNAMMKTQNYQQSIEVYKQALRLNPNDDEARYNLAYAQQMLKKQQQDQQGGGGQNDKKNDKKNDQQQKQDQQQNQDQQQDQQNQNQQNQQDKNQQNQQQQSQQQQQEISKEEAERMLEAMKNNEKKTLDKVKQQQVGKGQKTDKDW